MAQSKDQVVLPTIQLISDSAGWTGMQVARAAASQFGDYDPSFDVLNGVKTFDEIDAFLRAQAAHYKHTYGRKKLIVFYSLVDRSLVKQMHEYLDSHPRYLGVDLMSGAIAAISEVSGLKPSRQPGKLHVANEAYFKRISALDYTIAHDAGAKPEDLDRADVVLLGASRTGKTPVSICLSQQGLRVANMEVPPDGQMPKQIYDVEPARLFGLMTTAEVLLDLRRGSKGEDAESPYTNLDCIKKDLAEALKIMRQLGAIVVHAENRAAEETAQEILGYYMLTHPRTWD